MQRILLIFLITSILWTTISFCASNSNSISLDPWSGVYTYEEEPIKANEGYHMVMAWTLSINKKNNTCQGILEINGQQTFLKLLTDVSGDSNSIALTYNKLIDCSADNLKKGDTLFILSRSGNKIKTKWMRLESRLTENPPGECYCFDMTNK